MIRPFAARRTRQPQQAVRLDWSHPLARSLALAWVASAGDLDLVTGKAGSTEGTRPANQAFAGRIGRKFSGNGDISFGTRPDLSFNGLSNQTLFAEVFIPDTGSVSNFVCGRVQSNWDYSLSISSANQQFAFGTGGLAGGNAVLVPAASVGGGLDPYRGRPVPLCGTYDKVTAKLYVDGILKNSAALTGSFPNDTDQFAIGSRGGGNQAGQQLSGAYISIVLIFKRTLSDAEVASLSANPWQLFASAPLGMFDEAAAGGGSVTGTLASTEASDTLAATGSVLVTGTLASNEGADSLAAAGSVLVSGTLAAAEAADTLTASGTVANGVVGTMAITEGGDTLAGTGSVLVSGTLAQTEGADTLAADGAVIGSPISGTLAVTEEPDTLAATDAPPVTGGGDGGGAGGYGEVRRFADLLDKHKKLTRAQKKQRRKELVEEALELLPDLPQAEAIAPVLARLAYEQEAQVRARVVAQPALAPVVAPFDADAYLRELVVQWTADEDMRRTLEAEADEEYEIELLLMGA